MDIDCSWSRIGIVEFLIGVSGKLENPFDVEGVAMDPVLCRSLVDFSCFSLQERGCLQLRFDIGISGGTAPGVCPGVAE